MGRRCVHLIALAFFLAAGAFLRPLVLLVVGSQVMSFGCIGFLFSRRHFSLAAGAFDWWAAGAFMWLLRLSFSPLSLFVGRWRFWLLGRR